MFSASTGEIVIGLERIHSLVLHQETHLVKSFLVEQFSPAVIGNRNTLYKVKLLLYSSAII